MAEYYGLPAPSMRAAVWQLVQAGVPGYKVETVGNCRMTDDAPGWLKKRCDWINAELLNRGGDPSTVRMDEQLYVGAHNQLWRCCCVLWGGQAHVLYVHALRGPVISLARALCGRWQ